MEPTHSENTPLAKLAQACGIFDFYWDVHGVQHFARDDDRRLLLTAMGYPCADDVQARASLEDITERDAAETAPPVVVCRQSELPLRVPFRIPKHSNRRYRIELTLEDQTRSDRELSGDGVRFLRDREIEGQLQAELEFSVQDLPIGYHTLVLYSPAEATEILSCTRLIVVPDRCYTPPALERGEKLWGISAQLYSLHSQNTCGIGDTGALKGLLQFAAENGASFVGLNPLHSISPGPGPDRSPYSPSTRSAFNVLYIDLLRAAEYLNATEILSYLKSDAYAERTAALQATDLISYTEVSACKFEIFQQLYDFFVSEHAERSKEAAQFSTFVRERGNELEEYATYAALREHFVVKDPMRAHWNTWPLHFQDPLSPEVAAFRQDAAERVRMYQFLQWLIELQLGEAADLARDSGLAIGLYMDLALGAGDGGADTWSNRELYAFGMGMGAPPDALAPQGQNWGLPPMVPSRLEEACFVPFIQALRAAMRYSGALRIDHAMSLQRLYWVPGMLSADRGAYVRYPLDALMGILALESVRNQCLIIGEDLGTVSEEVQQAMQKYGVLSYKVFYFMHNDKDVFELPAGYQSSALVVTSTHDLPTWVGYMTEHDLEVRKQLSLHAPEVMKILEEMRSSQKKGILDVLLRAGYISKEEAVAVQRGKDSLWPDLSARVHSFLGTTAACIQAVQLEDLAGEHEQANLPGTVEEHPNWKRRSVLSMEALNASKEAKKILAAVHQARSQR